MKKTPFIVKNVYFLFLLKFYTITYVKTTVLRYLKNSPSNKVSWKKPSKAIDTNITVSVMFEQ